MVRKLEMDDLTDLDKLYESMQDNHLSGTILREEMKQNISTKGNLGDIYGIFSSSNVIIGCCSLSDADDFSSYKYWDTESKAISVLYIDDKYREDRFYIELFEYILHDKCNLEYNIYLDNDIGLREEVYSQVGFKLISDDILVRLSTKYIVDDNSDTKEEEHMYVSDVFTKCPYCGEEVKAENITLVRQCLKNENQESQFDEQENEPLCRKYDTVFGKAICDKCGKDFSVMITVEAKPVKCYSAEDRSELVTRTEE